MYEFLKDPAWQGIGAIAGIISMIISLWLARKENDAREIVSKEMGKTPTSGNKVDLNQRSRKSSLNNKSMYTARKSNIGWRIFGVTLSLLIPAYAIFVGSILLVNTFTTDSNQIIYGSVLLASLLGLLWGVVWANYIQRAFKSTSNRSSTDKPKQNGV